MNAILQGGAQPQPDQCTSLLDDLKAQPVWLLWRSIPHPDPTKKHRKVPCYANGRNRSGELDSPEDRARLVTHADALAAYEQAPPGTYAGLGIALGPDGRGGCWQGIDLDGIVAAGLTDIADLWTRGRCAGLGYVEASPSETGLHLLGYGRPFNTLGSNTSGIEAYAGEHFFTFTGKAIVSESPCRPYDLAEYVQVALAPRHAAARPKAANDVDAVRVDAQTIADLRSALAHMRSDDRALWVNMGMALRTLGDTGRGLWIGWSQTSELYDPKDAARTWDSFEPRATGHKAVFAEAMRRGWSNPRDADAVRHGAEVSAAFERSAQAGAAGGSPAPPASAVRRLVGRSLGGVAARAIEWLWTGWMPKGYITIFAGESGAGKSTVLADVAARVTTGRAWPGETADQVREPGRVLWLGSEDSIEEMTVPRLLACGADLNNVIQIEGVSHQGKRNTFSMQDDLEAVGEWLNSARADGVPFAMLVIDPVTSYLPGQKLRKVDLNDAGQLRTILEPWLVLAQEHHVAIVCVTHFAKDTTRSMLHRVMGSAAFAQTCRSLCAVIEREAKGDYEPEPHEKALIQVKVNLPEHPGGSWRFVTEKVEVATDPRNGRAITATRPNWRDLDGALTPKTAVGPARGPKSEKGPAFSLWLNAEYAKVKPGTWVPVQAVKWTAMRDVQISESWWNKHSGEFLERDNVNGTWMCRPIGAGATTGESG